MSEFGERETWTQVAFFCFIRKIAVRIVLSWQFVILVCVFIKLKKLRNIAGGGLTVTVAVWKIIAQYVVKTEPHQLFPVLLSWDAKLANFTLTDMRVVSVISEFDGGAGLSSLREQFSEILCSQWLSSAPHKPFQPFATSNSCEKSTWNQRFSLKDVLRRTQM